MGGRTLTFAPSRIGLGGPMKLPLFAAGAALLALAACDPISEDECRAGNWSALGLADGQAGRPESRFDDYVEICRGIGVEPDRRTYSLARQTGLQSYCTPDVAFDRGLQGRGIGTVCPADFMPALQEANRRGQKVHDARDDIKAFDEAIEDAEDRIFELASVDTDEARAEIRRLRSKIRDLEWDIFQAERVIRRFSR